MADSRHLEKSKMRHISAMDWPILMKFGRLMHADWVYQAYQPLKFEFLKIQDGGDRHFGKR